MYDHKVRASLAKIFLALINADNVVNQSEIEGFAHLRKNYGISIDDIITSGKMTFSQAVNVIVEHNQEREERELLDRVYRDVVALAVGDGVCMPVEAILLYAIRMAFSGDGIVLSGAIDNKVTIDGLKVFIIRGQEDFKLGEELKEFYWEYYYAMLNYGFELVDVDDLISQLVDMGEKNITEFIRMWRPDINEVRAFEMYDELKMLKSKNVIEEIVGAEMMAQCGRQSHLMLKICTSTAGDASFYDFILIPIEDSLRLTFRRVLRDYSRTVSGKIQFAKNVFSPAYSSQQCLSFSRSLFEMLEHRVLSNKRSVKNIIIDAVRCEISFEGLNCKNVKVPYKPLSLYLLVAWLSSQNIMLCRKGAKLTASNSENAKIKEYMSLAAEKYKDIVNNHMGTFKSYFEFSDPCLLDPQDFTRLKTKITDEIRSASPESLDAVKKLGFPISKKTELATGYVIECPAKNIYVKSRVHEKMVNISDLFR